MDGEKKKLKFSIGYLIIAFWAVLLLQQVFSAYLQPTRMSYSDFKAAVSAGRVSDVAIGRSVIRGHMKTEAPAEAQAGEKITPAQPAQATGAAPKPTNAPPSEPANQAAKEGAKEATPTGNKGQLAHEAQNGREGQQSAQQLQRETAAGNSFETVRVERFHGVHVDRGFEDGHRARLIAA